MQMVQEQIDILIKLQKIDAEIYKLREEKTEKPKEKQAKQEEFARKNKTLGDREDELKSLQLKRKEHEIDLETKEKEIKKYQSQLFQVKTNKEYTALQTEIEGRQADNAVLEEDILALMERIDNGKAEIAAEKEKLAIEEKGLKEEIGKIEQEGRQIDEELSSLAQERSRLCPDIEKGLLAQYERIIKAKAGLALVPIEGEACGGCHHVLPPQVINETQIKDRVITCDFCARLLYWPQ